jgi:hypothetical protein
MPQAINTNGTEQSKMIYHIFTRDFHKLSKKIIVESQVQFTSYLHMAEVIAEALPEAFFGKRLMNHLHEFAQVDFWKPVFSLTEQDWQYIAFRSVFGILPITFVSDHLAKYDIAMTDVEWSDVFDVLQSPSHKHLFGK